MVKNHYVPGMRSSLLFWNSISLETFVLIVGSNGTLKASWASCLVGTQYKLLCSALFHWLCLTFDDWCTECWMLSNVEGKNAWKKQKKTLNKIGSETSMKKHWKNVCVNYLQNVKFRVKKKGFCVWQPSMFCNNVYENDDENCQHFPLFMLW